MFKIFELVLRLQLAKSTPLSFTAQDQSKPKSVHVEDFPVQESFRNVAVVQKWLVGHSCFFCIRDFRRSYKEYIIVSENIIYKSYIPKIHGFLGLLGVQTLCKQMYPYTSIPGEFILDSAV